MATSKIVSVSPSIELALVCIALNVPPLQHISVRLTQDSHISIEMPLAHFGVYRLIELLGSIGLTRCPIVEKLIELQSHRVHSLAACPFRHLPRLPVHRLRANGAMPGPASRLPCRFATRPASRFLVPPSCPPDGEGRGVCGELGETARMPMIGWRRFPFSRHLVFDTG